LKFSDHEDRNPESIFLSSAGNPSRRPMIDFPKGAAVLSRKLKRNPAEEQKSSEKQIILLILPLFRRFRIILYYTHSADFEEGK
jgi:hypothetical protein